MFSVEITKRNLKFAFPAGTSRGVLHEKPTWYLSVTAQSLGVTGVGECSPIWGLSPEKENEYESILEQVKNTINNFETLLKHDLLAHPSIYFGLETAMLDLFKGGRKIFFENDFTNGKAGININGLVWMNSLDDMYKQAIEKKKQGFNCIKLKVGTHKTDDEIHLLKTLRKELGNDIILRIDANGAYDYPTAVDVLNALNDVNLHSIEQPLKTGHEKLSALCANNLVPIALDEELIGVIGKDAKEELISKIKPHYIVLKPSLHGGFMGCREWIEAAQRHNCGWWMTSALESNIGLNAIAQFTAQTKNPLHQGLGTGKIYDNNIESPLYIENGQLKFNSTKKWSEL
ncbi:MAG TPA: o-succinylbenzoate synthase [Flavobacteriales bacterium]|nr:o-succinylbenzoate synthase [Flavobacteriales bacterium]